MSTLIDMDSAVVREVLADVEADATHFEVENQLLQLGWTSCGAGDWAIALAHPSRDIVARISPFDPVGPYTARFYAAAASTGRVPALFAHRRLAGGGDLQMMEWLSPVSEADATNFLRQVEAKVEAISVLVEVVERVHREAQSALPWCGPLDRNPSNVMQRQTGEFVLADPFYADGPALYATAESDADDFVTRIPATERRFMTDIPLAYSGPWEPEARAALRRRILAADERRRSA